MRARVRGFRAARRRSVGAVPGVRLVPWKMSSAAEGGTEDVGVVHEGRSVADLGEQVAAEEGAGGLVEHHLRLPAVGHVRGRDGEDPVAADVERLGRRWRPPADGRPGR